MLTPNRFFYLLLTAATVWLLSSGRPAQAQGFATTSHRFEWAQVTQQQHLSLPGQALATDGQGYVYTVGTIKPGDVAQVGGTTLFNTTTSYQMYLAKLDPAGQLQWVQRSATLGRVAHYYYVRAMVADKLGNIFVAGSGGDSLRFGGATLLTVNTPGVGDAGDFVAKFDANGNAQWIAPLPFSVHMFNRINLLQTLAPDNLGNCLVGGLSKGLASLGGLPLTDTARVCGYVLKIRGIDGAFDWVRQMRGEVPFLQNSNYNPDIVVGLGADPAGNVLVNGNFGGGVGLRGTGDTLRFTPTRQLIATTDSTRDGYVAKYNAQGTLQWVQQMRAARISYGSVYMSRVAADHLGNLFVAGATTNHSRGTGTVYTTLAGLSIPGSGYFLAKLDGNGTGLWVRNANELNTDKWAWLLEVDGQGNPVIAGREVTYNLPAQVSGFDFFAASFSASGEPREYVTSGNFLHFRHYRTALGLALAPSGREIYLYTRTDTLDALGTLPVVVSSPAVVLSKVNLAAASAHVGGTVYFDLNGNGLRDSTEGAFPRPVVIADSATGQLLITPARQSTFGANVAPGTYTWQVQPRPYYRIAQPGAPGSYRVSLPTAGQRADTLTFGLAPIPGLYDLRVTLTAYTPARPGRVTRYRATVENLSTTPATGQLTVLLDAAGVLLSTAPAPTTTQGQQLTWDFQNLAPFGTLNFDMAVSLPVNLGAGTPVVSRATVTPLTGDQNPLDNTDLVQQAVVTSWDPNDLAVNFTQLTTAQIAAGQPLDYTVRFENLGTDTAFVVLVQDTLPAALLKIGTVELVGQSHNCQWTLTPAGVLTLQFPGIKLPNQAANAFFSQGFVRFRVIPRATLAGGQLIPNRAHIVFDYNAPLATNQALTLVERPLGLAHTAAEVAWALYPNPAAGQTTLTADLPMAGPVTVRLFDGLGRVVSQQTVAAPAGRLRHLLSLPVGLAGVYVVQLTVPGAATQCRRLVVAP